MKGPIRAGHRRIARPLVRPTATGERTQLTASHGHTLRDTETGTGCTAVPDAPGHRRRVTPTRVAGRPMDPCTLMPHLLLRNNRRYPSRPHQCLLLHIFTPTLPIRNACRPHRIIRASWSAPWERSVNGSRTWMASQVYSSLRTILVSELRGLFLFVSLLLTSRRKSTQQNNHYCT